MPLIGWFSTTNYVINIPPQTGAGKSTNNNLPIINWCLCELQDKKLRNFQVKFQRKIFKQRKFQEEIF
jgi:hypothetical protein